MPETAEQERGTITVSNTTIQIFKDLEILLLIFKDQPLSRSVRNLLNCGTEHTHSRLTVDIGLAGMEKESRLAMDSVSGAGMVTFTSGVSFLGFLLSRF